MNSYIKDYPRPQLVRSDWINLNGPWDFAFDDDNCGEKHGWTKGFDADYEINVPFTYETKMSGIGIEEAHEHLWYHRELNLTKKEQKRYIIHLEGSDYNSRIWVNGKYAGSHKGAYERASFDVTELLNDGNNNIVISVSDSNSIRQPRGKQRWIKNNFGCWYVQTTGIWKTVWLEEIPEKHIKSIKLTPDLDNESIIIQAEFGNIPVSVFEDEDKPYSLSGEISFSGAKIKEFTSSISSDHLKVVIKLSDYAEAEWGIHAWTPENPELYDLSLTLKENGEDIDTVLSYFGMRSISTENGQVLLNGTPLYQRLILDQGYWKDSHLTPPGEEALIEDIDKIKELGFNGLRKHMKIEDERFLYWCDVKGMLVWSEMAACYDFDDEAISAFTDEWKAVVMQNYNHPCIITWTPFNESWGVSDIRTNGRQQDFTKAIYFMTKAIDPMRPVITNDGWEHTVSDVLTLHDYEEDGAVFAERYTTKKDEILSGTFTHSKYKNAFAKGYTYTGQPVIISEYGGIAFTTSKEDEWGYGNTVASEDEFVERYRRITDAILDIPYIVGFCYTQVSDVQQEVNGLMTMDREFKVDPEKIRAINERATSFHK